MTNEKIFKNEDLSLLIGKVIRDVHESVPSMSGYGHVFQKVGTVDLAVKEIRNRSG